MADDLDLIEKKKKELLTKKFISLYMAQIIKAEEAAKFKAWQHSLDKFFGDAKKDPAKKIKEDIDFAYSCYAAAELSRERRKELFGLSSDDPDAEKIQQGLTQLNLDKDDFSVIALAATQDNLTKVMETLDKPYNSLEQDEVEEFDKIRADAVVAAKEAIFAYQNDRPEIFARLLGGGLRIACEHFATEPDKKLAAQWSIHIEDMVRVIKSNPILQKVSGLTEDQLAIAENIAGRGKALRDGLRVIEKRAKLSAEEIDELSSDEKDKFIGNIIRMEVSLEARDQLTKNWDFEIIEMEDVEKMMKEEDAFEVIEKEDVEKMMKEEDTFVVVEKEDVEKMMKAEGPVLFGK